jgi:hypothetical protein
MSSIIGSILSSNQSSPTTSFVNENTGQPCWTTANVKDVEIASESANADNPLSTQQVNETSVYQSLLAVDVQTSKIIRPSKMRITILADQIALLNNIMASFEDTTQTIQVTSKSVVVTALSVTDVNIEMSPDMLSANRVVVMLEQVQAPSTSSYNPAQAGDQSTVNLGVQTLSSVGPSLSTTVGNNIASLVSTATTAVGSLYQRVSTNLGL